MDMNHPPLAALIATGTPPADVAAVLDELLQDALDRVPDAPGRDAWSVLGAALLPHGDDDDRPMMLVGWWRPYGLHHAHMLTLYIRPDATDPGTVNCRCELELHALPAGMTTDGTAPGFGPNDTFLG